MDTNEENRTERNNIKTKERESDADPHKKRHGREKSTPRSHAR